MKRGMIIVRGNYDRERAAAWALKAPCGMRIEYKHSQRTTPQNARFWAMLSDVASQVKWHGMKLSTDDWKLIFLDALKREMRMVPNIDGNGFVNLGRSSSDLSKQEMGDLMELMEMFGAEHGVKFHDDKGEAA